MRFPKLRPRRIVCRQAVELVTGYLGGAPAAGGHCFEARLGGCRLCAECLAQTRTTIELTRSCTPGDLTPPVQDEFMAIYRRWRAVQDG